MEYPFKDLMPLNEATARTGYYRDWTHMNADTFHQISELVQFIREKGYGADTREAIAQALERVYHDASLSGNANMEVSSARGRFDTLGRRLNDTTAQLAQKANRDEVNTISGQIDNLIANAGDTDGNAELLDIRVGWDGVVYPTAGDAVRSIQQFMTEENQNWSVN